MNSRKPDAPTNNNRVKVGGRSLPLPKSQIARIVLGSALVLLGVVGFLPVVGFWMIPLGLLVLSVDLPRVRRWRRRFSVWLQKKLSGTSRRAP